MTTVPPDHNIFI